MTTDHRRAARAATVFTIIGAALTVSAGALAEPSIDIVSVSGVSGGGSAEVHVTYQCAQSHGATSVRAMLGAPTADRPAAQGIQQAITCDGQKQSARVPMEVEPGQQLRGETQVRAALVNDAGNVVAGQAKLFTVPKR